MNQARATRLVSALLASLVSVFAAAAPAAAHEGGAVRWDPRWTRFTTVQYTLTAALATGGVASDAWLEPAGRPRWRSPVLLDGHTRNLLAARSEAGRHRASKISDYLSLGLVLYPFAIDSLLVAAGFERSYDVAWQMAMIGLQSLLLTKLITGFSKHLVARARPDYDRCAQGNELACNDQTESFVSGHTSTAFVGAGLICANHQNLRLYGSAAASAIACGSALALAATAGALRIVSDRHYLTDVLAGAAIGLGAGYLLPNLTNYDFGESARGSGGTFVPLLGSSTLGASYTRQF